MTDQRASILLLASLAAWAACGTGQETGGRIEPVYDPQTGRLQLLKYDANADDQVDTWSYMDGSQIVRIEIDTDRDNTVDRWEYYGRDQQIEKVGASRANDGTVDSWAYYAADGSIVRRELSTARTGTINRIEYYENGALARAEEDTDTDGRIDKWETYDEQQRLLSVAFDATHRGTPDRRLLYAPDGSVDVEMLP